MGDENDQSTLDIDDAESFLAEGADDEGEGTGEEESRDVTRDDESSEEEGEGEETQEEETEETEETDEQKAADSADPKDQSIKAITAKYPKLFKEFPELRASFFRDQQFREVFETPAAARSAAEDSANLSALRDSVVSGDASALVAALREEKALGHFASNILTAIQEVDKDALWTALEAPLQTMVRNFYVSGKGGQHEKNISNAALFLSEFLFGNAEVATGRQSAVDEAKKIAEKARMDERANHQKEAFTRFSSETFDQATAQLDAAVDGLLAKDKDLTPFVRGGVKAEIIKQVQAQLSADKDHNGRMQRLWANAHKTMSPADRASIISAYLARAKQIMPSVKVKVVSQARGVAAPSKQGTQQKGKPPAAKGAAGGSGGQNGPVNGKKVNWGKTSAMDFLNDRVTFKQ